MYKNCLNSHSLRIRNLSWQRLLRRNFLLSILCGGLLTTLVLSSCKEQTKEPVAATARDVYYTCSMHPQVHEDHPGNCPLCGMKLTAVAKAQENAAASMQIQLSAEQIRLGNIQTDTARKMPIGSKLVLTGTLNFNQDKLAAISARVEGRLERLYFKNVGDYVAKGAKLYDLYSEELNNAKQEYIHAVERAATAGSTLINYAALVESAKNKLSLWGMTNAQIKRLAQSNQVSTLTTFYSTEAGYITAINVNEGEYVVEGGSVVQLASLSTLWAEAQVYTTQMASIKESETVSVRVPDLNQTINGTIEFLNPEINPDTRINLLRVSVHNKNNQLHPGMPVYITLNTRQHSSIALPADAVLRDSKGATVWVEKKPGVYEIRMVKTGIAANDAIEITEGLNEGDVVVISGAYLVNSEYIFQQGSDPMAGMEM